MVAAVNSKPMQSAAFKKFVCVVFILCGYKIDYKLKKVIGLDSVDVDSPNNEDLIQKIIKLNPKPININELFEN